MSLRPKCVFNIFILKYKIDIYIKSRNITIKYDFKCLVTEFNLATFSNKTACKVYI